MLITLLWDGLIVTHGLLALAVNVHLLVLLTCINIALRREWHLAWRAEAVAHLAEVAHVLSHHFGSDWLELAVRTYSHLWHHRRHHGIWIVPVWPGHRRHEEALACALHHHRVVVELRDVLVLVLDLRQLDFVELGVDVVVSLHLLIFTDESYRSKSRLLKELSLTFLCCGVLEAGNLFILRFVKIVLNFLVFDLGWLSLSFSW